MAAEGRGREVGGARNTVRSGTVLWGTGRVHFRQEILLNNNGRAQITAEPTQETQTRKWEAGWLASASPFSPSVLTRQHKAGAKGVLCGCFHLVPATNRLHEVK